MNSHHLLFSPDLTIIRKNKNIALAAEALIYARSIIPVEGSSTQSTITDPFLLKKNYKQIRKNRADIPTLFDSLYFLLVKWNDSLKISSKINMRSAKKSHMENCGVLSRFATAYLKKRI